ARIEDDESSPRSTGAASGGTRAGRVDEDLMMEMPLEESEHMLDGTTNSNGGTTGGRGLTAGGLQQISDRRMNDVVDHLQNSRPGSPNNMNVPTSIQRPAMELDNQHGVVENQIISAASRSGQHDPGVDDAGVASSTSSAGAARLPASDADEL
ncbi:unnamed protein product, partial [Amoebophrya sp. A25]